MSELKEFLRKQAEEHRASIPDRKKIRQEWIEAVDRLMDQLTSWLREDDPENILTVEPTTHSIRERRIGRYEAKGLQIVLGDREIRVEPVARYSIGSMRGDALGKSIRDGRVDLTNVEQKYMLYRQKSEDGDFWIMVDDRDYQARSLDPSTFGSAIKSMLE